MGSSKPFRACAYQFWAHASIERRGRRATFPVTCNFVHLSRIIISDAMLCCARAAIHRVEVGARLFGSSPERVFFDGLRDRQLAQLSNRSTWKKSISDLFAGLRDRRQAQLLNRSRGAKKSFSTDQSFAGCDRQVALLANRMWRTTGSKKTLKAQASAQETDIFAGLRDRAQAQQLNRSGRRA